MAGGWNSMKTIRWAENCQLTAVASREQGGPVAVTNEEITRFKSALEGHLGEVGDALDRSRQAENDAVQILGSLVSADKVGVAPLTQ